MSYLPWVRALAAVHPLTTVSKLLLPKLGVVRVSFQHKVSSLVLMSQHLKCVFFIQRASQTQQSAPNSSIFELRHIIHPISVTSCPPTSGYTEQVSSTLAGPHKDKNPYFFPKNIFKSQNFLLTNSTNLPQHKPATERHHFPCLTSSVTVVFLIYAMSGLALCIGLALLCAIGAALSEG